MTIQEDNMILHFVAGSHLWGTATPDSDRDFIGVYVEPSEYVVGLEERLPAVFSVSTAPAAEDGSWRAKSTAGDTETKWYTAREFTLRVLKGDPNLVPLLWVARGDQLLFANAIGMVLRGDLTRFLSQKVIAHHVMQVVERQKSIEKRMRAKDEAEPVWKDAMHMYRVATQAYHLACLGKVITPFNRYVQADLLNIRLGKVNWGDVVTITKEVVQDSAKWNPVLPRDEEIDPAEVNGLLRWVYTRHWEFLLNEGR